MLRFFYLNMTNVDYIIVGGGYAGLFFAHQLIRHNKSFVIFTGGVKGASRVSAGVINPVVLKKFTTFWLAKEQIENLHRTLDEIADYTGHNYLIDENIQRIFHDDNEKKLWLKKSESDELNSFLSPTFKQLEGVLNPYGTGAVNHSARLNVEAFFDDFSDYLSIHGHLQEEAFNYTELHEQNYQTFSFKNIVFCEGMSVRNNPYFSQIPVIPNKGHHLKVKLSDELDYQCTLKKKHFLFPLNEDFHYYGGTYDPNERGDEIDEHATQQLKDGLSEFYHNAFEVEEVNFGLRPTVKDRRPILGNHPDHPNYFVFNGLGARGILNGNYFAKVLFEHIEDGKPLMPEVDLKRFS